MIIYVGLFQPLTGKNVMQEPTRIPAQQHACHVPQAISVVPALQHHIPMIHANLADGVMADSGYLAPLEPTTI